MSNKFYNKCSENSRSQIVFRTDIFQKLTLGAHDKSLIIIYHVTFSSNLNFILHMTLVRYQVSGLHQDIPKHSVQSHTSDT